MPSSSTEEPVERGQIDRVVDLLSDVLGQDLIGIYLFGSSVLGGLRPRSDIDLLAVSQRPTTRAEKQQIVNGLLDISIRPRHIELTIVVENEIRPWCYPPSMDLQYGDWWREEFERGELEPWKSPKNPDLASLIRMLLLANVALRGPAPAEVFDPVPRHDYVTALCEGIDDLVEILETDTRNVVLTLARIWSAIVTDEVMSKDAAADWAFSRLPSKHQSVLAHARAAYLGEEEERWNELGSKVRAYADFVVSKIRSLT